MKSKRPRIVLALLAAALWMGPGLVQAQTGPVVDCVCVRNLAVLSTNACQAVIPDLCLLATNCFSTNVVMGTPNWCSQTPPAGTVVGPGTHYISVTVMDNQGLADQCLVPFVVSPAPGCVFSLLCATNKTVECGTAWTFDPPGWTNACAPPPGTPSNGVALTLVSLVTNGACPQVITATWQGVDDCGYHDQCSQTVTVVDSIAPQLDCKCLTNNAVMPVVLTVTACATNIPDLCLPASLCAYDACGLSGCVQSPPAGTPVGVGVHPITVQVYDCASNVASCVVNFTVLAPAGGCNTNPCVQPPAGLVGWWPLDETCGAPIFADISANGNAAIVQSGGPVCSGGSPNAVPGKVGGANYFYGASVRGRAPNAPSLNFGTGSFSLDGWIRPVLTGPVHWHPIVDKLFQTGPATGFGYKVALLNAQVVLVVGDGALFTYTSLGSVAYGTWNFVGVSVDRAANTVTFHVNGVTEPPQALAPAGSFNSPADLLIGGTWAANSPYGESALDELELFNQTLASADFLSIYQADAAGKCRPQPCTNSVISIYCPPNTNVQTCASSAVVFFPSAIASTSCGAITNLVTVPPSGSSFPAGTNTVTCTAYDSLGNSASCSFLVIVLPDTVPPLCPPASLSVTGCPPLMPDFATNSLITDNCSQPGQISVTQSVPPGTPLTGSTPVTVTVCDAAGNCQSCFVTVAAYQTPGCCQPVTFLRLFSGATNNVPGVLPGGAPDPQFLTSPPLFSAGNPFVQTSINGWWVPNSGLSKWVGPTATYASRPPGVYYYTNRFFLCSTNGASLAGRWTADDTGRIHLNGAPTANVLPAGWAFTNWHLVTITSGFVPGWNTLVFAVTNGLYSPTGLRTEITGLACCNTCVMIACPPKIVTNSCAGGVAVTYPPPTASSACGNIVSLSSSPPSGSVFPVGTNVVTCTAIDSQGNAATCSFTVTVLPTAQPITIKCPKDQILYTCTSSSVAYYAATATGNVGPITYLPPSGSSFPLGTNLVTCLATNACGQVASCTFRVIVKSSILGPPNLSIQAGLMDNFALPFDPASTNACLVASQSGFPFWKKFDVVAINTLFGHRFTGLPNNIVQAQLITRMQPAGASPGSDNDGLFIGLTNCAPGGWAEVYSIKTLPGAGGNWLPGHPATTFTNNLSAAVIAHMNSTLRLDVMVHDDTTVDYMILRLWTCPPPINPNGNFPHWVKSVGGNPPSTLTAMPEPELPGFGPIGSGPAILVAPSGGTPSLPNSVEIGLGGGEAFGFTTILDRNAPEGAEIWISAPTDEGTNAPWVRLVKSACAPQCGWNLKLGRKFFDEGGPDARVSAVNANGELLNSFLVSDAEGEAEALVSLTPEDGVDQFPVSFLFDAKKGEISLTFPGTVERRLCNGLPCPRGWDGTIKGRATEGLRTRHRGWDGTVKCPCFDENASRIVFLPMGGGGGGGGGQLPALVEVSSTGLAEFLITDERLYSMGQEIAPAAESLVTLQATAGGVLFTAEEDYSGITLDLGRSVSFDLGIHHSENPDLPLQQQFFRVGGPVFPPGTTTNRPPPPVFDLGLVRSANGVHAAVDFSPLEATGILIQLWSNGVYFAYGNVIAPAITLEDPLPVARWPERFALLGTNGAVRLTSTEGFDVYGFACDEIRLIPELPPGAAAFAYASEIECRSTGGAENLLYGLERVAACEPSGLTISATTAGTVISWAGEGYRLLGAETLEGPWVELSQTSPVVLPVTAPQRYYRLVCE
jgi:hypothetical protein